MKTSLIVIICLILGLAPITLARTVIIPADYPTIQEGIDSCTDGDTVLVKPGIYYENINFNGHNIVVASFFLTTGNPEYIKNTVIDGDSNPSVVTFENEEDTTAVIIGFTIQNGHGGRGGGIHCSHSNPLITKNIICNNSTATYGGGVYFEYSSATLSENLIKKNRTCFGAGIYCIESAVKIRGNLITDNFAIP